MKIGEASSRVGCVKPALSRCKKHSLGKLGSEKPVKCGLFRLQSQKMNHKKRDVY